MPLWYGTESDKYTLQVNTHINTRCVYIEEEEVSCRCYRERELTILLVRRRRVTE